MKIFLFLTLVSFIEALHVGHGVVNSGIVSSSRFKSAKEVESYYSGNPNIGPTIFVVETCLTTSQAGVHRALKALKAFIWLSRKGIIIQVIFHKYQFALRSNVLDRQEAISLVDSLIARNYESGSGQVLNLPGQQNYEKRWQEIITQNVYQTASGKDVVVHYLSDVATSRQKYSLRISKSMKIVDSAQTFRYLIGESAGGKGGITQQSSGIVENWDGTYYYKSFEDLYEHVESIEQHYKKIKKSEVVVDRGDIKVGHIKHREQSISNTHQQNEEEVSAVKIKSGASSSHHIEDGLIGGSHSKKIKEEITVSKGGHSHHQKGGVSGISSHISEESIVKTIGGGDTKHFGQSANIQEYPVHSFSQQEEEGHESIKNVHIKESKTGIKIKN